MPPFLRVTRFQLALIVVTLLFLAAGAIHIERDSEVFGVGLWQIALFFGIGTIAAGNVAWINARVDVVARAATRILAVVRNLKKVIDRHTEALEQNTKATEQNTAIMREVLGEVRETGRAVQELLIIDLQQLHVLDRTTSRGDDGPHLRDVV